jgi:FkbM family methyltransferase
MNLKWLVRNVRSSWSYSDRSIDFLKRLLWAYSHRIPCPKTFEIGFNYPPPMGRCRLVVRANDGSDAFVHGEVFEHQYYNLPLSHSPESILDLGANAGFASIYFSRVYPHAAIACVEPIAANLDILRQNLKLNEISATVFPAAVAASDGFVQMELHTKDYGHRIVQGTEASGKKRLEVRAISVPTVLGKLGWGRIGLLKVDIEGYEATLFSGACDWLNKVDSMCIECHEGFADVDLERLASRYGFSQPQRLKGTWLLTR